MKTMTKPEKSLSQIKKEMKLQALNELEEVLKDSRKICKDVELDVIAYQVGELMDLIVTTRRGVIANYKTN